MKQCHLRFEVKFDQHTLLHEGNRVELTWKDTAAQTFA